VDWAETLLKITNAAPLVGSLFGPAGTAIGGIINLAAGALGVVPTTEAITTAISTDPNAIYKLKTLENTHETELQKLVIESERIRLSDVADARNREKAVITSTGRADTNLYILAWCLVGGFFSLVGLLIFRPLPTDSNGVIMMLFGSLAAAFGAVIQYFFGSSAGSATKTEILNQKK